MREPRFQAFDLVAGVPYGGLHLATAYSLASDVPMIYGIPPRADGRRPRSRGATRRARPSWSSTT